MVAQFSEHPGPDRRARRPHGRRRRSRRRADDVPRDGCGHRRPSATCFECFYQANHGDFRRWSAQLCSAYDVVDMVDDVFSEATLKLFEHWMETITNARAYMRTILRHTACDAALGRGVGRCRPQPQDVALNSGRLTLVGEGTTEAEVLRAALRSELAAALRQLADRERDVAVCRYVLEMSATETAEHLGLPLTSATSALHRANKKLRTLLDPDLLRRSDDEGAPPYLAGGDEG